MKNLAFLNDPRSTLFWAAWAGLLLWQNYAFTYVSRARNSGSLRRHIFAAFQSNGVWFLQFLFAVGIFTKILTGAYGWKLAVFSAIYYTAFTMAGSIWAHYRSLRREKGLEAVGANKRFAQITVNEWANLQVRLELLETASPIRR